MVYLKCGREFLETGDLPQLAAKAVSELVTKKARLLGVGKADNWSLLGMSTNDLIMIDSLRKKVPGKLKGSLCFEYFRTMRGHCFLCHGEFYTESFAQHISENLDLMGHEVIEYPHQESFAQKISNSRKIGQIFF